MSLSYLIDCKLDAICIEFERVPSRTERGKCGLLQIVVFVFEFEIVVFVFEVEPAMTDVKLMPRARERVESIVSAHQIKVNQCPLLLFLLKS